MRFFSSVAFEKAPKFMLAASCSAADAMLSDPHPAGTRMRALDAGVNFSRSPGESRTHFQRPRRRTGRSRPSPGLRLRSQPRRLGDRRRLTTTLPPAASTAAIAASRAPATSIVSAAFSSPLASRRTPSPARRSMPAATSVAASTGPSALRLAGVDRLLQPAEVHDLVVLLEDLVVEAALRQAAMQRRLAALEAVDRDAAARGLALAAAARGLALARADAAADPLRAVMRARIVPDLVELHRCPHRVIASAANASRAARVIPSRLRRVWDGSR